MGVDTRHERRRGVSPPQSVRYAPLSLSIGIPQRLHEIGVKREDIRHWPRLPSTTCARAAIRAPSVERSAALYETAY